MSSEEDRFRKMIESSQDWFWEFDENANFTYVSPRIRDLLGFEPEELLGLNAFDLMSPEEAERVHQHFDPLAEKYLPFNNLINVNIHKDGHEVVIESSGTPVFDEGGKFRGYRGIDRDVTRRIRMEKKLRESRVKFQNILDTSSEWIWEINLEGQHTYSNERLPDLLGYSYEEFLGKDYSAFLCKEDVLEVKAAMRRLISEKKGWTGWVLRWRHKDGSYRFLESNAKPIVDSTGEVVGYSGADRDITERVFAEKALKENEALLAQTQQIAKVGSWEFNLIEKRLTWSDETYRIFGLKPQALVPTYELFLDLVHPEDRVMVDAAYSESLQKRQGGYEVEHRVVMKETGEVRYVHAKCKNELAASGEVVRSVGMVQDITDRKTSEEALLAATQAAEAADCAKSLFLAKVSHEIRTPMTAIVGFGELLEATELSSEQKRYLEMINSSSEALSMLIDDVLDLSKVDTGELALRPESFRLREFVANLSSLQEQQIAQKNLSFDVSIDENVPDLLTGDRLRIQQVLLNLLGNAIKFTVKGSINLAVTVAENIDRRILLDITVADTGIGISPECHESIFEPFSQFFGAGSHTYGGAGLGLTISRSLAVLMGGSLRVESQPGVGSTFHLLVPLQKQEDKLSEQPYVDDKLPIWNGPTLSILLAEDNPINIQFIKKVLEKLGHTVCLAENGKVAVDILKAKSFDLILMDIQMPVMNGVDALRVIRNFERLSGKHQNVIALTAFALIGDKGKYLKIGFDGYLSKPVTTRALVDELTRVLAD